jgi:hypothetical protein
MRCAVFWPWLIVLTLLGCHREPAARKPLIGRWRLDDSPHLEYRTFHEDGSFEWRFEDPGTTVDTIGHTHQHTIDAYGRYDVFPLDAPAFHLSTCVDGEVCLHGHEGKSTLETCRVSDDTLLCDKHSWQRVSHNP